MIDDLAGFACLHFEAEEALIDHHRAPSRQQHKREHRLLDDLGRVRAHVEVCGAGQTVQTVNDWLLRHLSRPEQELANYLKRRGVN